MRGLLAVCPVVLVMICLGLISTHALPDYSFNQLRQAPNIYILLDGFPLCYCFRIAETRSTVILEQNILSDDNIFLKAFVQSFTGNRWWTFNLPLASKAM
jgi:hypothetical protein